MINLILKWLTGSSAFIGGIEGSLLEMLAKSLIVLGQFFCFFIPNLLALDYLSKKFKADIQARVGPNFAGPWGIAHGIADFIKLLQKQDKKSSFSYSGVLSFTVLISSSALIPISSETILFDVDLSVFVVLLVLLVSTVIQAFFRLRDQKVEVQLGQLQSLAQTLIASFSIVLSLLTLGQRCGGYSWTEINLTQGAAPWHWHAFQSPFLFLAFLVFVLSGMVFGSLHSFDRSFDVLEMQGGPNYNLKGIEKIVSRTGRTYFRFCWGLLATLLFLGGWQSFISSDLAYVNFMIQIFIVAAKTQALLLVLQVLFQMVPQIKSEQISAFVWRFLGPASWVALVGYALFNRGGN